MEAFGARGKRVGSDACAPFLLILAQADVSERLYVFWELVEDVMVLKCEENPSFISWPSGERRSGFIGILD